MREAPLTASPIEPGTLIAGKYRVEKKLGEGAMGVVVAARHVELGQLVAIKVMRPATKHNAQVEARFLREAQAAARLKSRHVAKVTDIGTLDDGGRYLVMEHLEGHDLAAVLRARGRLSPAEAVELIGQACEAVEEAHASGVIHRDLKPANLFLTTNADGTPCVKILDFGVSKVKGAKLALTKTAQAIGSPLYMSPEQMSSAKHVDARTDLWSLGCVLHELLMGAPPFSADTVQELCVEVLFQPPTPLYCAGLPEGLPAVVARCLEKEPDRRFASAAELGAALAALPIERSAASARGIAKEPGASASSAWRRRIWLVAVIALVAAALVGGGAFVIGRALGSP